MNFSLYFLFDCFLFFFVDKTKFSTEKNGAKKYDFAKRYLYEYQFFFIIYSTHKIKIKSFFPFLFLDNHCLQKTRLIGTYTVKIHCCLLKTISWIAQIWDYGMADNEFATSQVSASC
jgi:hypothetical protein